MTQGYFQKLGVGTHMDRFRDTQPKALFTFSQTANPESHPRQCEPAFIVYS